MSHHRPFYDIEISREEQQEYINSLLCKHFKGRKPSPELKKEIWDLLCEEKHHGRVSIPFQVVYQKDEEGGRPDYIEVVLDTKV